VFGVLDTIYARLVLAVGLLLQYRLYSLQFSLPTSVLIHSVLMCSYLIHIGQSYRTTILKSYPRTTEYKYMQRL